MTLYIEGAFSWHPKSTNTHTSETMCPNGSCTRVLRTPTKLNMAVLMEHTHQQRLPHTMTFPTRPRPPRSSTRPRPPRSSTRTRRPRHPRTVTRSLRPRHHRTSTLPRRPRTSTRPRLPPVMHTRADKNTSPDHQAMTRCHSLFQHIDYDRVYSTLDICTRVYGLRILYVVVTSFILIK